MSHPPFCSWCHTKACTQRPDATVNRATFMRVLGRAAGALALGSAASRLIVPAPVGAAGGPGQLLGNVRALRPNSALSYTDPASGDPAVLIRLATGRLVSYDAVCTHAGCTVTYDPARRLLACPCHGALYDPARAATVVGGPAPSPLATLAVRVDAQDNVYALDGKPGTAPASQQLQPSPPPGTRQGDDDTRGRGGSHGDDGGGGSRGGGHGGDD
jgi:Rieske Fe-S protein